jgi:DNA-binding NtrC family response regulator
MARILLIDDDDDLVAYLQDALAVHGHDVQRLDCAERGPDILAEGDFDLVLLDNKMPRMSGIDFLEAVQQRGPRVPVILMTGHATTDTAIQAINLGAFDYVVKPLDFESLVAELLPLIGRAAEITRAMRERVRLPGEPAGDDAARAVLLGNSKPMLEVYKLIGRFATSNAAVLILGGTGTGKELVARAVHSNSTRRSEPFVAFNCNVPNESLLDDELFGHEPGAFPGADKLRKGAFEHAHRGTLFLDKIDDMPLGLQAKVLHVLESRHVRRQGGGEPLPIDIRLLAATRHDPEADVREGRFREDLYFRLKEVTIRLPPLRERGSDLQVLAEHFAARAAEEAGRPAPALAESAWAKLRGHAWPGNVRELANVVRRAVLVARGPSLLPEDLELGSDGMPGSQGGGGALPATRWQETPGSGSEEAIAGLRQAIRWALRSGHADPSRLLHDLLERELSGVASSGGHSGSPGGDRGAGLIEEARRSGVLEPEQQDELDRQLSARFPEPRELTDELLRRGWLTAWQLTQLAEGRDRPLVLGQYVLLDVLGQGGMGEVFKARQRRLKRVVALKVIRGECFRSPGAVQRFRREIEAAARLAHPNIVRIYDADEHNGLHFLAMEYVEGTDLDRLLKRHGPLPVPQACAYVRQAATGLQHAHECGLVHRDVKPSNLLLAAGGVIKLLDLGLARLEPGAAQQGTADDLTQSGAVLGTPDYIAPEQALNARTVDIRADLYSLGCTFYHFLTGQAPFNGSTWTQKLLQHQLEAPAPVEQLRPDVPPAVAAVVRRLMAKHPQDRYQTPAEVVAALGPLAAQS